MREIKPVECRESATQRFAEAGVTCARSTPHSIRSLDFSRKTPSTETTLSTKSATCRTAISFCDLF